MKLLYNSKWLVFLYQKWLLVMAKDENNKLYRLWFNQIQAFQINGKGIVRRNSCDNFTELLEKAIND